jgi:D-glycero-D-manno-heptose 1,7-bisphosphate phosphatase
MSGLKAVFLDRDGVLSVEKDRYLNGLADFEILSHVVPNLKRLKEAGYIFIMISNQGGISRDDLTVELVDEMHEKLRSHLSESDLELAEYYYCPHHPEKEMCTCRKPEPLMILKAIARFGIDGSKSFMIGDSPRDVEAAKRAGVGVIENDINPTLIILAPSPDISARIGLCQSF